MNLKKITDESLLQGTFVFGNENDRVNLINRVCPSLSNEEIEDIFNKLEEKGVDSSDKLFFVLGSEDIEGSILEVPIKGLKLSFRRA